MLDLFQKNLVRKVQSSFNLTQIAQISQILFAWRHTVLTPIYPTFNSQMFSPENSIYSSFYFLFSFFVDNICFTLTHALNFGVHYIT
jgi:hypothetical protein